MTSNKPPARRDRRSFVTFLAAVSCLPPGLALAQANGPLPKGFTKFKGPTDGFFQSTVGGQPVISIRSQASGGIVRCPVDFPLRRWASENREIAADALVALKQMPSKVVAVWLIHYTVPQKRLASTDFRRISFATHQGKEQVIFPA
jgi:hypothetical protein